MRPHRPAHPLFWLLALGALFVGMLGAGRAGMGVRAQGAPTPGMPPLPPSIPDVPPGAGVSGTALEALRAAVNRANQVSGASTFWAGGVLGVDAPAQSGLTVGEKLPAFGLMTRDGEPFQLDLHGRPLLVNFWASWCPPCVEEFPLLIAADRAPLPFDVVFVSIWDDPVTFLEFLADYPADIRVMIDVGNTLPALYALEFVPVSVLVDAQGIVQLVQLGPVNDVFIEFAAAVLE